MKLINPSKLKLHNYVFGDIVYTDRFPYSIMDKSKTTAVDKNRPQVVLQNLGNDLFLVCKISSKINGNYIELDKNDVIQQELCQISPGVVNNPKSTLDVLSNIHHDTLITLHRSYFIDYKHLLNQEKRKELYSQLEEKFNVNYKISDYQKLQKESLLFEQINKNIQVINMDIPNILNKLEKSSLEYIQEYINLLNLSTIKETSFTDVIITGTSNIVLEYAYEIEEELYWGNQI